MQGVQLLDCKKCAFTPTFAELDTAYAGGWFLWRSFSFSFLYSGFFLNFFYLEWHWITLITYLKIYFFLVFFILKNNVFLSLITLYQGSTFGSYLYERAVPLRAELSPGWKSAGQPKCRPLLYTIDRSNVSDVSNFGWI